MESKHPTVRPGIAAGVKTGRMVSISATRNCPIPKDSGAKSRVRAVYMAAMRPPSANRRSVLPCFICNSSIVLFKVRMVSN